MQIVKEVDSEMFENIIVTALEGGSNYWYLINTDEFKKELPSSDEPLSIRIAGALYNDTPFKLNVYDIESGDEDYEDKELLGVVTYESCKKAFDIMAKDYSYRLSNFINESYDADDADVFFQLATMGEVTFG